MGDATWAPDLKNYPHFDAVMSEESARALATDPEAVATNKFYPFLLRVDGWQPYRLRASGRPGRKERPIRYASRRDAYIYSYYRHLLAPKYERALKAAGLDTCVLAYRRLRDGDGRGMSNVEFARDAFSEARRLRNCAAVALDVSSFFESLDHALLEARWAELLQVKTLPPDHAAVFKSITKYAVVDRDEAYERLGFIKREVVNGRERITYTKRKYEMPKKLCSGPDFRKVICGKGGVYRNLVDVNRRPYGIPQGSPISDLLANVYMIGFDEDMARYCRARDGCYCRYSDDILVLLPGGESEALAAAEYASSEIRAYGPKMRIKESKTSINTFTSSGLTDQEFTHVSGQQGANGLEYLGFRYDGKRVFLRDATVSRLFRKLVTGVRGECAALIARYPGHSVSDLISRFDYSGFYERYGRVRDFDRSADVRSWTFWTYARRAASAFGPLARHTIPRQIRHLRPVVRRLVVEEIVRQTAA